MITKFVYIFDQEICEVDIQKVRATASGNFFIYNKALELPRSEIIDLEKIVSTTQQKMMQLQGDL